jgi:ATP-GRASP peptide maturase of grasp-with-spasm system
MKKSVLILSSSNDSSTNKVMDWIHSFNHKSLRINGNDFYNSELSFVQEIGNEVNKANIKCLNIDTNKIDSIWYRKGSLTFKYNLTEINEKHLKKQIYSHLIDEYENGKNNFFHSLLEKKSLGSRFSNPPTKIDMLIKAKEINIDIPDTIITNNKTQLELFIFKYKEVITKPISEIAILNRNKEEEEMYVTYTELINKDSLKDISNSFFPSLFQEALRKEIEIRTFYLDGICYSMAIFSQLDNQTNVDFRMYNYAKNNRNVPYKLSNNLEKKISKLMISLNLKTGSLDFVKTKDGRIVFLEVNPWGQYGMTSVPCNYNLDKKIAKFLTNE